MKRERESGIEILRIFAMLAIVAGHFAEQGGVPCNGFLPVFVTHATRTAVDVFLVIGCWFMVSAPFRPERLVRLYAEVAFYSIPITLAMVCLGEAGGARNVIQGLLPFFGRSVWFATAYISLIALSPFLNILLNLPRRTLDRLVVLLLVLFVGVSTVPQFTAFEYLADFSWFLVVYLLVGWAKRYGPNLRIPPVICLFGAVAIYTILCLGTLTPAAPLANYWLSNLRGLPIFLCAILLFRFFHALRFGALRPVNLLARSTFAVYVVHQCPPFERFEWSLFHPERFATASPASVAVGIVTTSIIVFAAVSAVDAIRIHFIEPRYMSARPTKWLIDRLKAFYGLDTEPGDAAFLPRQRLGFGMPA